MAANTSPSPPVNLGLHAENSTASKSSFDLGSSPKRQLGLAACKQIERHLLIPILKEQKLKPFHSLVRSVPNRIVKKQIVCLRDLEKTLLWLAPVSSESTVPFWSDLRSFGLIAFFFAPQKYATSRSSYLNFSEFTIQCLHTSTSHLNDRDQRLPTDRPYTNGYFLDLVSQVRRYAAMVRASRNRAQASGASDPML